MCDADSVITSCNIMEHDDLKQKYMWDGTGDDLGRFKNELNDIINYKKDKLHFDQCILNGCEFYALKSNKYTWYDTDRKNKLMEYADAKVTHKKMTKKIHHYF